MQNPHEEHQKVLASFLSTIARDGGWWYRIPKGTASDPNKEDVIPQDAIMPHFGTLFGLSEAATQIILHEMGLLNYDQNNQRYSVQHNGWEDLASMFQVKHLIELESTKFNKKRQSYVRLGIVSENGRNPNKIWKAFTKDKKSIFRPSGLTNRRSTAFVTQELVRILRKSKLFPKIIMAIYKSDGQSDVDLCRIG
jgi:hypothetical protein